MMYFKPKTIGWRFQFIVYVVLFSPLFINSEILADWRQAAGPNDDYQVNGNAVTSFRVSQSKNVLWKTSLPNTGESAPIIANGRVFLTCHTPMTADAMEGREIYGICFDAETGEELWRRKLPATRATDMASGFSDNTAASPVSDGQYVCFINVGGSIQTYDFAGELIWSHQWVPFGRHHARQQEPILHQGSVIFLKTVAENLSVSATTKAGAKPLGRDKKYWTRLHSYDLATGQLNWIAESATSVHSASILNRTLEGRPAILTGRGGGHQPPEEPYGLSLIDAASGQTIWDLAIKGYAAHQNAVWDQASGGLFVGMNHHKLDISKALITPAVSLSENVQIRARADDTYVDLVNASLPKHKRMRPTTYHTNCLIGNYHYFRAHNDFYIGRINLSTEEVEYLQVPPQVDRNRDTEKVLWQKPIENDVKNKDGYVVCQDQRAKLSGWGHVSAASPIVVGDYLYMPTMLGTVYVLRWDAPKLDENALVSISDLGLAGKTWTLSNLTFCDGKLYARTIKELICIGKVDD